MAAILRQEIELLQGFVARKSGSAIHSRMAPEFRYPAIFGGLDIDAELRTELRPCETMRSLNG